MTTAEFVERLDRFERKLEAVLYIARFLARGEKEIMATLDQIAQDMTDESTAIDGVSALITGLQQQVQDVLSGATLPPATQAKIDAIFTQAESNKAKLAAALAANVPPPPPPPVTPPAPSPTA